MVQFVRGRGRQTGEPPQAVKPKSQQSLFGNGQEGERNNQVTYPLAHPQTYCQRKTGSCLNTGICQGGTCANLSPTVRRSTGEKTRAEEQRAKEKFAQTSAGKVAKPYGTALGPVDAAERAAAKPTKVAYAPSCHLAHPPYPVFEDFTVIGGSGIFPHVKDCDVYCSLDRNGTTSMPWETGATRFVWEIKNYGVPTDVAGFKHMVTYLAGKIKEGKKVHVGCMAGHGRTGMVLAALRFEMAGDPDAIMHVRNNYCNQAVEPDGQIKWLMDHYGMNKAPPREKKYKAASTSASSAGAFKKGDWADEFDTANEYRFDDNGALPDTTPREPHQNSWAANSPWLKELEGPPAQLEEDKAWYE